MVVFKRCFTGNYGFTLLEVMVATLILVLVVAGTFAVCTAGERFVREAMHRTEALDFARQALEQLHDEVKAATWDSVNPGDPLSPGTHALLLPAGDLRDRWAGVRQYLVTDLDWDGDSATAEAKRVTVTVTWNEPGIE